MIKKKLEIIDLIFLNFLIGSTITYLWRLLEFLIYGAVHKKLTDTFWLLGLIIIVDILVDEINLSFEYKKLKVVFWNSNLECKIAISKKEHRIQILKSWLEWRE